MLTPLSCGSVSADKRQDFSQKQQQSTGFSSFLSRHAWAFQTFLHCDVTWKESPASAIKPSDHLKLWASSDRGLKTTNLLTPWHKDVRLFHPVGWDSSWGSSSHQPLLAPHQETLSKTDAWLWWGQPVSAWIWALRTCRRHGSYSLQPIKSCNWQFPWLI